MPFRAGEGHEGGVPEEPCPRCAAASVLRLLDGYFVCSRCQIQWRRFVGVPIVTGLRLPERAEAEPHAFSRRERARLLDGRRAVQAGFYTDG